jgi:hypothetical protein
MDANATRPVGLTMILRIIVLTNSDAGASILSAPLAGEQRSANDSSRYLGHEPAITLRWSFPGLLTGRRGELTVSRGDRPGLCC